MLGGNMFKYNFMGKGKNYLKAVMRIMGNDFEYIEVDNGLEIMDKENNRIFSLIDSNLELIIRFDYPTPNLHNSIIEVHIEDKHFWEYRGNSMSEIVTLLELVLQNYKEKKNGENK
jgi:hypothetical protein